MRSLLSLASPNYHELPASGLPSNGKDERPAAECDNNNGFGTADGRR